MSPLLAEVVTRADLEEAIANHNDTLRRMPAHWTDRRASLHAKIDQLLDQWGNGAGMSETPGDEYMTPDINALISPDPPLIPANIILGSE